MTTLTNTVITHIGYTAEQYDEMKFERFANWVLSNTKPGKQAQMAMISRALRNNFIAKWESMETRYLSHLAMFKKEQTKQGKKALFFDYLQGFNHNYPKRLNPDISRMEEELNVCAN